MAAKWLIESVCTKPAFLVIVRFSATVINIIIKSNRERKGFISPYSFYTHHWEKLAKAQGRSWCRGHRGMLLTGLLPIVFSTCLLIAPRTTLATVLPPTGIWALPHESSIKKMHDRLAYRPLDGGIFYQLLSLLQKMTLACVKLTSN